MAKLLKLTLIIFALFALCDSSINYIHHKNSKKSKRPITKSTKTRKSNTKQKVFKDYGIYYGSDSGSSASASAYAYDMYHYSRSPVTKEETDTNIVTKEETDANIVTKKETDAIALTVTKKEPDAHTDCCAAIKGNACFCRTDAIKAGCDCQHMISLSFVYLGADPLSHVKIYDAATKLHRCKYENIAPGDEIVCDLDSETFSDLTALKLERGDGSYCTGYLDTSCNGDSILDSITVGCDDIVVSGYITDDYRMCDDGLAPCKCSTPSHEAIDLAIDQKGPEASTVNSEQSPHSEADLNALKAVHIAYADVNVGDEQKASDASVPRLVQQQVDNKNKGGMHYYDMYSDSYSDSYSNSYSDSYSNSYSNSYSGSSNYYDMYSHHKSDGAVMDEYDDKTKKGHDMYDSSYSDSYSNSYSMSDSFSDSFSDSMSGSYSYSDSMSDSYSDSHPHHMPHGAAADHDVKDKDKYIHDATKNKHGVAADVNNESNDYEYGNNGYAHNAGRVTRVTHYSYGGDAAEGDTNETPQEPKSRESNNFIEAVPKEEEEVNEYVVESKAIPVINRDKDGEIIESNDVIEEDLVEPKVVPVINTNKDGQITQSNDVNTEDVIAPKAIPVIHTNKDGQIIESNDVIAEDLIEPNIVPVLNTNKDGEITQSNDVNTEDLVEPKVIPIMHTNEGREIIQRNDVIIEDVHHVVEPQVIHTNEDGQIIQSNDVIVEDPEDAIEPPQYIPVRHANEGRDLIQNNGVIVRQNIPATNTNEDGETTQSNAEIIEDVTENIDDGIIQSNDEIVEDVIEDEDVTEDEDVIQDEDDEMIQINDEIIEGVIENIEGIQSHDHNHNDADIKPTSDLDDAENGMLPDLDYLVPIIPLKNPKQRSKSKNVAFHALYLIMTALIVNILLLLCVYGKGFIKKWNKRSEFDENVASESDMEVVESSIFDVVTDVESNGVDTDYANDVETDANFIGVEFDDVDDVECDDVNDVESDYMHDTHMHSLPLLKERALTV